MSAQPHRIAASYARRTTDEPPPPAEQHAILRELAERHGFVIPEEYRFEDVASGGDANRPGFSAMIANACQGDTFSRLYLAEPSRLGRWSDPARHYHLRSLLSMLGVEIVFACDQPLEVRR